MRNNELIYLVGPMGAGKSTIGRLLADTLRLEFHDVDREIEERSGVDIPWIFDMEGEQGFRDREALMLQSLSEVGGAVVSTGGGAVLRDENRRLMAEKGRVVYLCTSVEEQIRRTAKDRKRPLLQQGNPEEASLPSRQRLCIWRAPSRFSRSSPCPRFTALMRCSRASLVVPWCLNACDM